MSKHTKKALRHRFARVSWPAFLAWAKAHGAQNQSITSVRINGDGQELWVISEGHAHDEFGRPYLSKFFDGEIARWQTTQPLRWLP